MEKKVLLKNGQEVIIRKAVKADAQALIDYGNVIGGESDNLLFGANEFGITLEQEERFIEGMANSKASGLFVALIDGEVVALANLSTHHRKRAAHTSEIGMSVRKKYWGLGIGDAVLDFIIEFAKASGQIEIIGLSVRVDNLAAQGLYRKKGFVEIGRYPKSTKIEDDYFDTILMNLYL